MNRTSIGYLTFSLILFSIAPQYCSADDTVSVTRDVVYGIVDGRELKLDLALPAQGKSNGAAIVIMHGGGWRQGNKSSHTGEAARWAELGYVSASVGYRLFPEAIFPAQVDDVRCAVRYLRSRSEELGFDQKRMGAMGFSAGAHLAMMLGVIDDRDAFNDVGGNSGLSSKVAAVVSYFGPTQLDAAKVAPNVEQLLIDFLGGTSTEKPDAYFAASPINYVDPSDASMLLFQGTRDPLVPFDQAVRMADKLTRENVAGRVELLLGMSHGWGGQTRDYTNAETIDFFAQNLLNLQATQK